MLAKNITQQLNENRRCTIKKLFSANGNLDSTFSSSINVAVVSNTCVGVLTYLNTLYAIKFVLNLDGYVH